MRILIADSQVKVRHALCVLLGRQSGLKVVGQAADGKELLHRAEALRPDLVLLHWQLPGMEATELLDALRRICPRAYVIVLSARPEARPAAAAAGADAFVSKVDPPEKLLAALREAQAYSGSGDLRTLELCVGNGDGGVEPVYLKV